MAGMYRIILEFEKRAGDQVGHSERWDFAVGSDEAAKTLGSKLAFRRQTFLPNDWFVKTIRIASLDKKQRVDTTWRFKQTSVQICNPPSGAGGEGNGEIDGGAVYYKFQYLNAPGRAAIRLFTPIPEDWWGGSSTTGTIVTAKAEGAIQPWKKWLKLNDHRLFRIDKTTGTITPFELDCVQFKRAAVKKLGGNFDRRRGRRFAHRTPAP